MSSDLKKNEKQMFKAICEGNWEVVYELLKKYPNFLTYDFDDSQCKLLHCIAIRSPCTKETEDAIKEISCLWFSLFGEMFDLELKNKAGCTPLYLSSLNGNYHQLKAFLELGASRFATANDRSTVRGGCCGSSGAKHSNKQKIRHLLDNPPPKYVPHTDIHYHFDKLELCDDEPDEPVGDD